MLTLPSIIIHNLVLEMPSTFECNPKEKKAERDRASLSLF